MQTALSVHSACERNSNDKVLYMGSHLYSVGSHRNRSHKSYDNYIYIRTISKLAFPMIVNITSIYTPPLE